MNKTKNLLLLCALLIIPFHIFSMELIENPGEIPRGARSRFSTDFSRSTVGFDTILSGGPRKDGIPSIDSPDFISVSEANPWLSDREPVLLLRYRDSIKVYPLQILMWHEIVNDSIEGRNVAVTYCPLCNTGIAFRSEIDGRELEFGTTGRLRFSNLIMYDRESETWWQQASGEGIVGRYAGRRLRMLPIQLLSWREVKESYADKALVLSRKTGYSRSYGKNPYSGYDSAKSPFLYRGPEIDAGRNSERSPMDRVISVHIGEEERGFSYSLLKEKRVIEASIGGKEVVLLWQSGAASALDAGEISEGKDVGSVGVFFREIDGRVLNFYREGRRFRDRETKSLWSVSGRSIAGELSGRQLESPVAVNHFWFSWNAFRK